MTELPPELLAAILAEPDEDAPRLVAADWLEEHGDAVHARLIRVECRLDRDDLSAAERDSLTASAGALAELLVARTPLGLPPDYRATRDRGFVDTVRGSTPLDTAAVERLTAFPLLESLEFLDGFLAPEMLPALARLPNLRSLRVRRLPDEPETLLAELARLPRLCHFTTRNGWVPRFEALRAEWRAGRPEAAGRIAERPQVGVTRWEFYGRLPNFWPPPDSPGPSHLSAHRVRWPDLRLAPEWRPGIAFLNLRDVADLEPGAFAGLLGLRELRLEAAGEASELPRLLSDTPRLESLALSGRELEPHVLSATLARLPRLRHLRLDLRSADRPLLATFRGRGLLEVDVPVVPADVLVEWLEGRPPLAVAGAPTQGAALEQRSGSLPRQWTGVPVFAVGRSSDRTTLWTDHGPTVTLDDWLTAEVARWPLAVVPGVGAIPVPPALTPVAPFDIPGWEGAENVACWAEDGVPPDNGPPLSCDRAWLRAATYPDEAITLGDWLRERTRPMVPRVGTLGFFGGARAREAGPMSARVYWAARREGAVVALAAGAGAGRLYPWRAALAALARRLDAPEGRP